MTGRIGSSSSPGGGGTGTNKSVRFIGDSRLDPSSSLAALSAQAADEHDSTSTVSDSNDSSRETEVDFVTNPTQTFLRISHRLWDMAATQLASHPSEARIWIISRYDDDEQAGLAGTIKWRNLPLHMAVMHAPHPAPLRTIQGLIDAYPHACRLRNAEKNLPLHLACDNNDLVCNGTEGEGVLFALVDCYPDALLERDEAGRLPADILEGLQGGGRGRGGTATWRGESIMYFMRRRMLAQEERRKMREAVGRGAGLALSVVEEEATGGTASKSQPSQSQQQRGNALPRSPPGGSQKGLETILDSRANKRRLSSSAPASPARGGGGGGGGGYHPHHHHRIGDDETRDDRNGAGGHRRQHNGGGKSRPSATSMSSCDASVASSTMADYDKFLLDVPDVPDVIREGGGGGGGAISSHTRSPRRRNAGRKRGSTPFPPSPSGGSIGPPKPSSLSSSSHHASTSPRTDPGGPTSMSDFVSRTSSSSRFNARLEQAMEENAALRDALERHKNVTASSSTGSLSRHRNDRGAVDLSPSSLLSRVTELETTLSSRKAETDALKRETSDLKSERDKIRDGMSRMMADRRSEASSLRDKADSLTSERDGLVSKLRTSEQICEMVTRRESEALRELEVAQEETERVKAEGERRSHEMTELRRSREEARREAESSARAAELAQRESSSFMEGRSEQDRAVESLTETNKNLRAKVDTLKDIVRKNADTYRSRFDAVADTVRTYAREKVDLENELTDANEECRNLEARVEEMGEEREALEAERGELRLKVLRYDGDGVGDKRRSEEAEIRRSKAEEETVRIRAELSDVSEELSDLREERKDLEVMLDEGCHDWVLADDGVGEDGADYEVMFNGDKNSLVERVRMLLERGSDLSSTVLRLRQRVDETSSSADEQENRLAAAVSELRAAKSRGEGTDALLLSLRSQLDNAVRDAEDSRSNVDDLRIENSDLMRMIADERESSSSLRRLLDEARFGGEAAAAKASAAAAGNDAYRAELDKLHEENTGLQISVTNLGANTAELNEKLQDAEGGREVLEEDLKDLREELEQSEGEMKSLRVERDRLSGAEADARDRAEGADIEAAMAREGSEKLITAAREAAKVAETASAVTMVTAEEQKRKAESHLQRAEEAEEERDNLRSEREASRSAVDALRSRVTDIENELRVSVERIKESDAAVRRTEAALRDALNKSSILNDEADGLQSEVTTLNERTKLLERERDAIAADANVSRNSLTPLTQKGQALADQIERQREHIATLESRVSTLRTARDEVSRERDGARMELTSRQQACRGAQERARDIAEERDRIGEELERARKELDLERKRRGRSPTSSDAEGEGLEEDQENGNIEEGEDRAKALTALEATLQAWADQSWEEAKQRGGSAEISSSFDFRAATEEVERTGLNGVTTSDLIRMNCGSVIKIAVLRGENGGLKDQIAVMRNVAEETAKKIPQMESARVEGDDSDTMLAKSAGDELTKVREVADTLAKENRALSQSTSAMKDRLKDQNAKLAKSVTVCKSYQGEIRMLMSTNAALKSRAAELARAGEGYKSRAHVLARKVEELIKNGAEGQLQQGAEKDRERERLMKECDDLREKAIETAGSIGSLQSRVAQLSAENEELSEENENLRKGEKRNAEAVAVATAEFSSEKAGESALRQKELLDEASELRARLVSQAETTSILEGRVESLFKEGTYLRSENEALKEENDSLGRTLHRLQDQATEHRGKLKEMATRQAQLCKEKSKVMDVSKRDILLKMKELQERETKLKSKQLSMADMVDLRQQPQPGRE